MSPKALALQTYRVCRNSIIDLQYGRLLFERPPSPSENTDYGALTEIFSDRVKADDVLVDVGCGKGRVINFWLRMGLRNEIYGLEFDPSIAEWTRKRLRRYPNVTILTGDALMTMPQNGTLFYLFNPFDLSVMREFKHKVESLPTLDRLRLFYYNCKYLEIFEQDPNWIVDVKQVGDQRSPLPYSRFAIMTPVTDTLSPR